MMLWVLLLFTGGLILILAEFLIPGGICGVIGGAMIIASCVFGCINYPEYAFFIIFFEVVGTVVSVLVGLYVLPHTPLGSLLILKETQNKEEGWVSNITDIDLLGAVGEVKTALRPAGTILVDGKRVDAVSDGTFIDKGATVRVVEVHGNRVLVEEDIAHVDEKDAEKEVW
jgi:membrane-bound serine protease (ClpP class)